MSIVAFLLSVSSMHLARASQLFHTSPLIIGHRGSPCSFPEETINSYEEAILQGASYLEMDVVGTKDRRLVLRHDLTLDDSTNIKHLEDKGKLKQEQRTVLVDGANMTGYFVSDFTFDQIHNLSAIQPFSFRDAQYNHAHPPMRVLEFKEILRVFKNLQGQAVDVGLYIEIKHPDYHANLEEPINLPEMMMEAILAAGITRPEAAKLVIQCFSFDGLKSFSKIMREHDFDIPLVLLRSCQDGLPDDIMLKELASLGSNVGVGPDKFLLLDTVGTKECRNEGQDVCPSGAEPDMSHWLCMGRLKEGYKQLMPRSNSDAHQWVKLSHSLGVMVHVWTVRNEDRFMALDFRSDVHLELDALMSTAAGLGVDGVFMDCPITGAEWVAAQRSPSGRRRAWNDQGALDKLRGQMSGTAPPLAVPPPQPLAAAITLAIVAVLVAACFLWVWCRRREERRDPHGTYKAMPAARANGGSAGHEKQAELAWSAGGGRAGAALAGEVESRHAQSDGGGAMWSPGGQRVGSRSVAEVRATSANGLSVER